MTNLEMCNKYQIKNSLGQLVYFATEGSLIIQLISRFFSVLVALQGSE